jgi:hypothetical protein
VAKPGTRPMLLDERLWRSFYDRVYHPTKTPAAPVIVADNSTSSTASTAMTDTSTASITCLHSILFSRSPQRPSVRVRSISECSLSRKLQALKFWGAELGDGQLGICVSAGSNERRIVRAWRDVKCNLVVKHARNGNHGVSADQH